MATFGAKMALTELQPKNHYDRHRTYCTCDEKKTASMISGHTWNIINHSDKDEVYLMHARNPDHYIDAKGLNTNHWFEKKRSIDLDGDGVAECLDSSNVQEVMWSSPDSGKEASYLGQRQARQIHQSEHPRDYRQFSARRDREGLKTPERVGFLAIKVPFQERMTDVASRPTPRIISKSEFTPRRDERMQGRAPPVEHDMFRSVDQLRTESHMDPLEPNLASAIHSARAKVPAKSSLGATASSVLESCGTARSQLGLKDHLPPKPAAQRQQHSMNRIEPHISKELTGWFTEKAKKDDAFLQSP